MKTDTTSTLNGFGDQDPFALNKAKETFSAPITDPFGSAFSAQQSNVSFFYDYVHVSFTLCSHAFYIFSCDILLLFCKCIHATIRRRTNRIENMVTSYKREIIEV